MVMKRTREPWMKAADFGHSLPRGVGINLLVPEIAPMEVFCRTVLGANTIYADEDFAAIELQGSVFMLHADHSYLDHEMTSVVDGAKIRGTGIEIRIYGADPDRIEARARDVATSCSQARRTSRTGCANAISSHPTDMFSCQAGRSGEKTERAGFAVLLQIGNSASNETES